MGTSPIDDLNAALDSTPRSEFLDIRQLSAYLGIKPATLYAWAAQGRLPCRKIHGLLRFRWDEIEQWLDGFRTGRSEPPRATPAHSHGVRDLNRLIASAKREVYTGRHGETRLRSSLIGKEETDGAVSTE